MKLHIWSRSKAISAASSC